MENTRKKILKLSMVGIILVITVLLFIFHPWKKDEQKKVEEKIQEPAIEKFGTSDFTISEFKENCDSATIYEDQYLLSNDAWQLNIVTDKKYDEIKKELNQRIDQNLSSTDSFTLDYQATDPNNGQTIYKYKGINLFMFQFDLGNLSAKIQSDVAKTLNLDILTKDEMNDYLGRAYLKATDILLHYSDEYKETEEREIVVEKKNGEIINGDTLYNQMIGMNSPSVVDPGMNTYGQEFINKRNIRITQIYQDAIKKGYYDLNNPLKID